MFTNLIIGFVFILLLTGIAAIFITYILFMIIADVTTSIRQEKRVRRIIIPMMVILVLCTSWIAAVRGITSECYDELNVANVVTSSTSITVAKAERGGKYADPYLTIITDKGTFGIRVSDELYAVVHEGDVLQLTTSVKTGKYMLVPVRAEKHCVTVDGVEYKIHM